MCEMVNHDLRLWVNELMRFALPSQPPVVPPPPDTVFAVPPLPAFSRMSTCFQGGGGLLKIVEETSRGRVAGEGHSKRKAAAVSSSPGPGHTRKNLSQPYDMFAVSSCMTPPPADSPSSAALIVGGGGISTSVRAGSRAFDLRAANGPRVAGGGGASGGRGSSSG